jgi:hypothetical protein
VRLATVAEREISTMAFRLRGVATAVAGAISLSACMHTSATMLGPERRGAVDPSTVVIYTSADRVPNKYDELALIDSHGDDALTSYHGMLEAMRKQAAKVGANGVILNAVNDAGTVAKVAHVMVGTSADRKGKAVAIYVYPAPDSTRTAAATTSQR